MVVEMGETRQVCGLVGTGSSGDAVGLGQQLGLKDSSEEGWHGKCMCGICDAAEAVLAMMQEHTKFITYLLSLLCFRIPSLLLCFEDVFCWPTT